MFTWNEMSHAGRPKAAARFSASTFLPVAFPPASSRFSPQSSAASADHIVSSVQAYISAHYGEQLSLDQLAQQFYLSSSYLSRLFKRETGTTLTTYLQNVRIEAAKNLLRTTALKSYEVAERVGINDPVYFSRIFKKITGLKPKDYRHSVQNESSV